MATAQKTDLQAAKVRNKLTMALVLFLLAILGISVATYAWFTISDRARSTNMRLDVVADNTLRFDLDAHSTFEQYTKTLSFAQIGARMASESGFDVTTSKLEPVTTTDYATFTYENGTTVDKGSGAYLEFTLHFFSESGCTVHLSSANGEGDEAGTAFQSSVANLPQSMRMSFTADGQTWVYDPNRGDTSSTSGNVTTFGLPASGNMTANSNNAMFSLTANTDKPVIVRIWMEGTDPSCDNSLKGADYAVTMRFEGVRGQRR